MKHKEQYAAIYLDDFAYKSKMSATTALVFDALLYHCKIIKNDKTYRVRQTKFVSQQKISLMIGKSERTVSKSINAIKKIESGFEYKEHGQTLPIPLLQVKKNQYGNATYTIVTNKQNVPDTSCTKSKNDVFQQEGLRLPTRTHDVLYEHEDMSSGIYKQNNNKNNKIITKANNRLKNLINDNETPDF